MKEETKEMIASGLLVFVGAALMIFFWVITP